MFLIIYERMSLYLNILYYSSRIILVLIINFVIC